MVATIGLHGSASTWVFNVVRELMIASFGENRISAVYTEELGELPSPSVSNEALVKYSEMPARHLRKCRTAGDSRNSANRFWLAAPAYAART